ncbi:hypothetical protein ACIFUY_06560 [Streptomyces sp. CACIS-1.16CA]|uniref:hypothetical protein n=1 Tax=Streptomyces sp. CACIS-1.16CA TaxID=1175510 RepID=UPI0037D37E9D
MGLFSSRKPRVNASGKTDAQVYAEITSGLEDRERRAEAAAGDARQREAKWDRVVRNMTSRGEDHEGRDMAIRNRDRARADLTAAETAQLSAKSERSNYRRWF